MNHHPNIELIERAVEALGELTDQLVFLGGSTTTLLMTDPAAPPARASIDVDAIIRIGHLADYHTNEINDQQAFSLSLSVRGKASTRRCSRVYIKRRERSPRALRGKPFGRFRADHRLRSAHLK